MPIMIIIVIVIVTMIWSDSINDNQIIIKRYKRWQLFLLSMVRTCKDDNKTVINSLNNC